MPTETQSNNKQDKHTDVQTETEQLRPDANPLQSKRHACPSKTPILLHQPHPSLRATPPPVQTAWNHNLTKKKKHWWQSRQSERPHNTIQPISKRRASDDALHANHTFFYKSRRLVTSQPHENQKGRQPHTHRSKRPGFTPPPIKNCSSHNSTNQNSTSHNPTNQKRPQYNNSANQNATLVAGCGGWRLTCPLWNKTLLHQSKTPGHQNHPGATIQPIKPLQITFCFFAFFIRPF